ncbi:MAG: nucleotide exchange factor GrpE [Clostridiales Family XIII bacterium]|jgi:molecular chaperone GrpE|nr:nucleotide exchange factor GrpE [Clostridiales Family XIII bacterium]
MSSSKTASAAAGKKAANDKKNPADAAEEAKSAFGAENAGAENTDAEIAEPAEPDAGQTDAAGPADPGDGPPAKEEELQTKYMRLAADFQNYKRRAEKEKSDIYAYANEKIAASLLEVIDNFERALEHDVDARDENFSKGMELIFKQLLDVLEKNGVDEIISLGEEFDPALHHAVMMEESEAYESGKVSGVLSKGYRLKEKVIRPAMVKVAQ